MSSMKFDFKVIAKNMPMACVVSGVALVVVSCVPNGLGFGVGFLGVLLIFAGIGLQILYMYWNRRS